MAQPQLHAYTLHQVPGTTHPSSQLHQVTVDINPDHTPRPERSHNRNREVPLVAADVQTLLALEPGPSHQPQSRVAGADESGRRGGGGRAGVDTRTGRGSWGVPVAGAVVACSVKREGGKRARKLVVYRPFCCRYGCLVGKISSCPSRLGRDIILLLKPEVDYSSTGPLTRNQKSGSAGLSSSLREGNRTFLHCTFFFRPPKNRGEGGRFRYHVILSTHRAEVCTCSEEITAVHAPISSTNTVYR